ncbi:MAG: hypothetical protein E6G08_08885 [Actinobacteria bacterium]|nr:MAG: hypothetical protein E6G08_08885 [Actinomycetota bacterium]
MPRVVTFSPLSRVASRTDPATAAMTVTTTTAIREAAFMRIIIPPKLGDSLEIARFQGKP